MSIVLIGKVGSGKSTLYNTITLSTETKISRGDHIAKNVFMKPSGFGSRFKVIDTPDLGSETKKVEPVAGVLSALAQGPVSRIMIVTSLNPIDEIIEDVNKILSVFLKYRILITVIITFWDECWEKDKAQRKIYIEQRLNNLNITSVIFCGKHDSGETICKEIDVIVKASQAQNIELTEQDIFSNFYLTEYDELEIFEIKIMKVELVTQYNRFYQQANYIIQKETTCVEEKLSDQMYALTQFALNLMEQLVQKFEKSQMKTIDNLDSINQLQAFQIHYELKSSLFKVYENLVQKAHEKMSTYYSRYIKKCNFCHQVWINTTTCQGVTICGSLVDDRVDKDILPPLPPARFQVTYNKQKLEVTPVALNLQEKNQAKIQENLTVNQKYLQARKTMSLGMETVKVSIFGCYNIIDWRSMLPLTDVEWNYFNGFLDYGVCRYIKQQEELIQMRIEANRQQLWKEVIQFQQNVVFSN